MRGRDKEREKRERDLEKKAREQADQSKASFSLISLCFFGATGPHPFRVVGLLFVLNPPDLPFTTHQLILLYHT